MLIKKKLRTIFKLFVFCSTFQSLHAGNKWTIQIKNNSDFEYNIVATENKCWLFDEVKTPFYIAPHELSSFQTHESYHFPSCSIGWHALTLEGFLSEKTDESVHMVYFENTVDKRTIPYPTSIKQIMWINYSNHENEKSRNYLNWDYSMKCDSSPNNGQMNLLFTIKNNGDVSIEGDHCIVD